MTALEPPSDRVILRPHDPDQMTAGGIVLPEIAQGKSQYATVLAVGEGIVRNGLLYPAAEYRLGDDPWEACMLVLVPGDVVVMPRFNGTEIDYDGETVISILASELLAVVT